MLCQAAFFFSRRIGLQLATCELLVHWKRVLVRGNHPRRSVCVCSVLLIRPHILFVMRVILFLLLSGKESSHELLRRGSRHHCLLFWFGYGESWCL